MDDEQTLLPDDPLEFIKQCVTDRKILWTYHVNMRMKKRSIARQLILESKSSYEIIEAYPEDKYLPSYLVYAQHGKTVFHVLFAVECNGRKCASYHCLLSKFN